MAFLAAGTVPLMPFVVGLAEPFAVSIALTLAVLAGIGGAKSHGALSP